MKLLTNLPAENKSQVGSQSLAGLRSQRTRSKIIIVAGIQGWITGKEETLKSGVPKSAYSYPQILTDSKSTLMGEKTARSLGEKQQLESYKSQAEILTATICSGVKILEFQFCQVTRVRKQNPKKRILQK